jgi:hypothetical protein
MVTFILAGNGRYGLTKPQESYEKKIVLLCETVCSVMIYICMRKARTFKFVHWKNGKRALQGFFSSDTLIF